MSYPTDPIESAQRRLEVYYTKGCPCEFCGRLSRLGASKTCAGCGAPNTARRRCAEAKATPAIMYDPQMFDGNMAEYLFQPGMNIPINLTKQPKRGLLQDIIHAGAYLGAALTGK